MDDAGQPCSSQRHDYTPMQITEEEIDAGRTANGGFTREQLAKWNVPWPPPKGWKRRLLTEEA